MASIGAREISLKNSRMKKEKRRRKNCWNNSASHCIYYILWIGDKQKLDTTYASFRERGANSPEGDADEDIEYQIACPRRVYSRGGERAAQETKSCVPEGWYTIARDLLSWVIENRCRPSRRLFFATLFGDHPCCSRCCFSSLRCT